jgi:deoxyribonuclease IV
MPRLGAHMSIAGGLPLAVDRAIAHRCEAFQIFTRSPSQWAARPLPADECATFRARVASAGLGPVVAHASYLINLGTAAPALRARSIQAFGDELDRAETLGLLGVVVHPGASTGGSEEHGLDLVADAVRAVLDRRGGGRTHVILEHTAGQGTSLGWRFEQLARVLDRLKGHPRVGICLDTCHLFAAGYDLASAAGYRQTFDEFDRLIGFRRLEVLHLNDSRRPLGSRLDRHEHIGKGEIGLEAFGRLLNDRRLAGLPMVLETPKSGGRGIAPDGVDPLDARNLRTLRRLESRPAGPPATRAPRTPRPGTGRPSPRSARRAR